jgi:protocatechuate 3,4-dioxygenase beta subunit
LDDNTTDENGSYQFCGLIPGDYYIKIDKNTLPSTYTITTHNAGSDDSKDSDVNETTAESDIITITDSNITDLDGGATVGYCLGDYIWKDDNRDGIQDDNESGIKDVKIILNETGATTLTDSSGKYEFCDLKPGSYSITVDMDSLPFGYVVTKKDSGSDDTNDSDLNENAQSESVTIKDNNITDLDGGFYETYCLGDFVWDDEDGDGSQDATEDGISGVKVILYDINGNEVDVNITDEDGNYKFCNIPEGDYYIVVDKSTIPDGYMFTTYNGGQSDTVDSDINRTTGQSDIVTIKDGSNSHLDVGLTKGLCLGDYVWEDVNGDGIQDENESGVGGVKITLNETGETVKSNSDGYYEFCGLTAGDYSITVDLDSIPSGYILTTKNAGFDDEDSDVDQESGKSDSVTLEDENITDLDIGIVEEVNLCLGDYVWNDKNQNGIQDSDEIGIEGVKITLNELNVTVTTDSSGKYEFCGLEDGTYSITVDKDSLPEGYKFTTQNSGDDTKDSDINPDSGKSDSIELKGDSNRTLDIGLYNDNLCLGNRIWNDKDRDGIQDYSEVGVADINITLYDANGTKLAVTTTDNNGIYNFCELKPGDYYIVVDKNSLPDGYLFTTQNVDNDERDSDINPETGKSDTLRLEYDNNYTLDGGIYKEDGTYCLGDFIWDDKNQNGIQDSGEEGVAGVKITLNETGATTTTDSSGKYEFCGLENGTYSITVDKDSLPEGYKFTTQNSGDDTKDSDINPDSGKSDSIKIDEATVTTLDGGIYKEEIESEKLCLGDYVWYDENKNGIQDSNESGVSGVVVTLLDVKGEEVATTTTSNGAYKFCNLDAGMYTVKFDLTSLPDKYAITYQNSGDDDSIDSDANPKNGRIENISLVKDDMTLDVGIYKNDGGLIVEESIVGKPVTVEPLENELEGADPETVFIIDPKTGGEVKTLIVPGEGTWQVLDDGKIVFTPEVGFKDNPTPIDVVGRDSLGNIIGPVVVKIIYRENSIKLGDYVWYDENMNGIQDDNEAGVVGVKVTLTDKDGNLVKDIDGNVVEPTETDSKGYYNFANLAPNREYIIKFRIPNTYLATKQNAGSDDAKDSDADRDGIIRVTPTEDDLTLDLGIYCECNEYADTKSSSASFGFIAILATILSILLVARRGRE